MKERILFYFFSFFFSIALKAQLGKEAWHWYFGNRCALHFNTGNAISGSGPLDTVEGTAAISNTSTGQLLFYTNGVQVWNKNHNQMLNGDSLFGHISTTQSALIVPKPGSQNLYYIFTCDMQGGSHGVCYSVVDINLNGGLGDLILKNQQITPSSSTEKLTGARHCNGVDFWIIDHAMNSDAFNAYLLSSTGLNPIPVVSNIGPYVPGNPWNSQGVMKTSPDGKKLALGNVGLRTTEIYDFNNTTGIISNPVIITYPNNGIYGISFSPDNSKLYASDPVSPKLYQYDLSSSIPSTIIASESIINSSEAIWALQLAPNGRIYGTVYYGNLAVINNPNALGTSCNMQPNSITVSNNTFLQIGLPNYIEGGLIPRKDTVKLSICKNTWPVILAADSAASGFGWSDGAITPTITVNNYGNYWVTYTDSSGCQKTDTFHVLEKTPPRIDVLKDTMICSATGAVLLTENATYPNVASYAWNDGTNSATNSMTGTGIYWVDLTLNDLCVSRDSFELTVNLYPLVDLGRDTTFCTGNKFLNAGNSIFNYSWNTGAISSYIIATEPGTYWAQVNNQGCVSVDTMTIYPDLSLFEFVIPNIVTPNDDQINDRIDFSIYQFSTMQLDIYNRWGNKIFESADPACVWYPEAADGTYFYSLKYKIDCGINTKSETKKGFITLVK